MVRMVNRRLKKLGVEVVTGAMVQSADKSGEGVTVTAEVKGEEKSFSADKVMVAVGRKPNTDEIGLDLAGIETDDKGIIPVDRQMRTKNSKIFAIGDVAGQPCWLTRPAMKERWLRKPSPAKLVKWITGRCPMSSSLIRNWLIPADRKRGKGTGL